MAVPDVRIDIAAAIHAQADGDVVTGVEQAAGFCERCGARGVVRSGELEPCRRCGLLTCADDRAAAGICRTCAEAARLSARRAGVEMADPVPAPAPRTQGQPATDASSVPAAELAH